MDASGETKNVAKVGCYSCGAREDPSQELCSKCGAGFRRLCSCGATVSMFASRCPSCAAPVRRARTGRRQFPVKKIAIAAVVLACGGAGWMAWSSRTVQVPAWRLRNEGIEHFQAGRFEDSARAFARLTESNPLDAQGWYMLAVSRRSLSLAPDTWLPLAKKAATLDPTLVEALVFLASEELARGRLDSAREYAARADAARSASAHAAELVAAIEMAMPRPDAATALDALLRAKSRGSKSPDLPLRIAEVRLRIAGPIPTQLYPPDLVNALRDAEAALADDAAPGLTPDRLALARARLRLVLGTPEEALRIVESALARVANDSGAQVKAQLLVVRARALCARSGAAAAAADLGAALAASPDAETAIAVAVVVRENASPDVLVDVLRRAAQAKDPTGIVHAALADVLLARGDLDGALAASGVALQADAGNARVLVLRGDVLAAQGELAGARESFAEATRRAPSLVDARVRTELLALAEPTEGAARTESLRAGVGHLEALRSEFGGDAQVLGAIGAFRSALGDRTLALQAFEEATKVAPASIELWLALAKSYRDAYGEDSLDRALRAYRQARLLAPGDGRVVAEETFTRLCLGDAANAVVSANSYLGTHPADPTLLRLRARAYRDLGQWRQAAADLRSLARIEPDDETVLVDLVTAEYAAGDSAAASVRIDEARGRVSPQTLALLEIVGPLQVKGAAATIDLLATRGASVILAELQLQAGRVTDAVDTSRALFQAEPANLAAARILVFALLETPERSPARIAEARTVIGALAPSSPPGLRDLLVGRVLLAEREFAQAVTPLRSAAAAMPGDALAQVCYGEALIRSGSREQGLDVFRRAAVMPGAPLSAGPMLSQRLTQAAAESKDPRTRESLAREAEHVDAANAGASEILAQVLHARGEFRAAAEVAGRALTIEGLAPAMASKLRERAIVSRLCAGDSERALAQLDALAPEQRDSAFAATIRGFAHLKAGRYAEAEHALEPLALQGEGNQLAAVGLVQAAIARGDVKRALDIVAQWRGRHPSDRDVPLAASKLFIVAGRFAESVESARICLSARPGDRFATATLVDGLVRLGKSAEAVDAARRMESAAPQETRAESRLLLAASLVKYGGDADQGLRIARDVRSAGDVTEAHAREASVVEAEALLMLDRDAESEAVADSITQSWVDDRPITPVDAGLERRVRFVLGTVAGRADRIGVAVKQFARCVEIDPLDVAAGNNLAWALTRTPNSGPRALEVAKRVTSLDATLAEYWDTRAQAAVAARDEPDADASWIRALDICSSENSRQSAGYGSIAVRYLRFLAASNRTDDVRRIAQRVIDRAPDGADAVAARGFLAK